MLKYEWNMPEVWDTIKRPNVGIMGIEEGEDLQIKSINSTLNYIIAENFPKIEKERDIQIQEDFRTPN
jgi:hypothetical protein